MSLTPNGWRRVERALEVLRMRYPYRSRLLGWLLLEGAEVLVQRVKAQKVRR